MNRGEILQTATQYVTSDRESQYGSPEDNFSTVADLWSNYLFGKGKNNGGNVKINAEDVAVMMCLLKIARIASGQKKDDNYIDLAGYAACAGEIATK
jgi:hypothetical protein